MTTLCECSPAAGSATCELNAPQRQTASCPTCGSSGKRVDLQTVKALVAISLRQIQASSFWFCRSQHCPVVYFAADNGQTLTIDQIRERVYQKEPERPDVLVCYCFQHRVGDIQQASPEERAALIADIKAGIAADQCACDIRNPQGSCCLGNVQQVAKRVELT
ncbi:putative iron-sulfur cluster-binding metallochaperone [Chloroflexus sp.]|uniref:putative iron-sulfur cluster-binding metallochaperone n=1 Tax=Chloroflexus sp. TaxID=1904827 RepID=UPI002ADD562D|nr:hypothetical protein [Chloroflexus sp.]